METGVDIEPKRPLGLRRGWLVAPAFGMLTVLVAGCGQFDDVYQVDMINDTGQPISLGLCADDACTHTDWREPVQSGVTLPANASSDTPTAFVAVMPDGSRKCLTVTLGTQPKTPFRVTRFKTCPAS